MLARVVAALAAIQLAPAKFVRDQYELYEKLAIALGVRE